MNGWQLPFPRKSLGLQIVDGFQGVVSTKDIYKLMIPGSSTVPATTSAVFTTVRDNQPSVCVLILHGKGRRCTRLTHIRLTPRVESTLVCQRFSYNYLESTSLSSRWFQIRNPHVPYTKETTPTPQGMISSVSLRW